MNVNNISTLNTSKINLSTATRAFEASKKDEQKSKIEDFKNEDINLMDSPQKASVNVADIQQYAKLLGENVTIDDINYGLMYGRSVIADYSA